MYLNIYTHNIYIYISRVCVRHDGMRECGEERMGLFIVHRTRIMYAPMPLPNNTPRAHTHTNACDRAGECKFNKFR